MPRLPKIEPVSYQTAPEKDIVYGLRLSIPKWGNEGDFEAEIGKISDDQLKTRLLSNYIGLADNCELISYIRKVIGPLAKR